MLIIFVKEKAYVQFLYFFFFFIMKKKTWVVLVLK